MLYFRHICIGRPMNAAREPAMTLYVNLAELLGTRIENGFYRPGDRLFHIRIAQASDNPAYALMIQHLLAHEV